MLKPTELKEKHGERKIRASALIATKRAHEQPAGRRHQIRVSPRHLHRGRGPNPFLKTLGECADDLRTLLTQELAGECWDKGQTGYGLATTSRAAAQFGLSGDMVQDKRGQLTFWKLDVPGSQEN